MCKLLALLAIIVTLASGTSTPSSPVSAENKPPVAKSHPFQAGLPTAPSGSFSHPPSSGLFSTGLPTPITGPSDIEEVFDDPSESIYILEVLQNIENSKIEEKREEAKLRRSLEETVEFYDNNRIEECLMEYFEERENWNQVPDENQNYLAPIMTLEHVRMV
ncbi:Protein CBG20994 [Caenorhabditis briggsae]|uniref:Protein CBG20994 n=1 Tax=Caenorhabditis briggsae TaxID=6238 RepID=A8XZ47_CAEBR|nr:Protein CBG20994 [Caenorhabditis briggsae]CAP37914.1 Protein CBG20994 [Caenorhabditis briggsae]